VILAQRRSGVSRGGVGCMIYDAPRNAGPMWVPLRRDAGDQAPMVPLAISRPAWRNVAFLRPGPPRRGQENVLKSYVKSKITPTHENGEQAPARTPEDFALIAKKHGANVPLSTCQTQRLAPATNRATPGPAVQTPTLVPSAGAGLGFLKPRRPAINK